MVNSSTPVCGTQLPSASCTRPSPVGRAALTVVHLVRIGAVGLDGQSAVNAGNAGDALAHAGAAVAFQKGLIAADNGLHVLMAGARP